MTRSDLQRDRLWMLGFLAERLSVSTRKVADAHRYLAPHVVYQRLLQLEGLGYAARCGFDYLPGTRRPVTLWHITPAGRIYLRTQQEDRHHG